MIDSSPSGGALKPQYFKLLLITSTALLLYLLYKIYQENIHVWSCESQENAPSCAVVGLISEERKNPMRALSYYKVSCDQDYGLGCYHLGKLYRKMGEVDKAHEVFKKGCELDFKLACAQLP